MKNCKRISILLVLPLLAVVLLSGTVTAGSEAFVGNEVRFMTTTDNAYTLNTTDGRKEIATVEFKVAFDEAAAGYLEDATIILEYDAEFVTFADARPAAGWGSVDPDPIEVPGNPNRIYFQIDPVPAECTIPISTDWTTLAEFDFTINCGENWQSPEITIVYGVSETEIDDGTDIHYVTESNRVSEGRVGRMNPWWAMYMIDNDSRADYPGALGTEVVIPVILGAIFKVASVDMTLTYDVDDLEFLGIQNWDESFVEAVPSTPAPGQVHVYFGTDESAYPRHEIYGDVMVELRFRVIGDWEGQSTVIDYASVPILEVALDDGTCDLAFSQMNKVAGTMTIPSYTAAFSTAWLDGGTMSAVDDEVSMQVQMVNNFPAGGAQNAVVVNLDMGTQFESDGYATGADMDFGLFTYTSIDGEEVSLKTMNANGFADATSTPADLVSFDIVTTDDFVVPTDYDDRYYNVYYQTSFNGTGADAVVTDTTAAVGVNEGDLNLTWDTPEIEYLMGEFSCNYADGGQGTVNQEYYTRNAFDPLADFEIKITVTGSHHMYNIVCEDGVEIVDFDPTYFKWAILATDANWAYQEATDSPTKFATITYAYSGGSLLAALKDTPELPPGTSIPGPSGYWVTKTSTVAFEAFEAGDSYMADDASDEHFYLGVGNTVRSRWWVDPLEPADILDLSGYHGIPIAYMLNQNYPNPFNPSTEIIYGLPEAGPVELTVYNISGQKVETLVNQWQEAGYHAVNWDAGRYASGIYLYRISSGDFAQARKMVLVK